MSNALKIFGKKGNWVGTVIEHQLNDKHVSKLFACLLGTHTPVQVFSAREFRLTVT